MRKAISKPDRIYFIVNCVRSETRTNPDAAIRAAEEVANCFRTLVYEMAPGRKATVIWDTGRERAHNRRLQVAI